MKMFDSSFESSFCDAQLPPILTQLKQPSSKNSRKLLTTRKWRKSTTSSHQTFPTKLLTCFQLSEGFIQKNRRDLSKMPCIVTLCQNWIKERKLIPKPQNLQTPIGWRPCLRSWLALCSSTFVGWRCSITHSKDLFANFHFLCECNENLQSDWWRWSITSLTFLVGWRCSIVYSKALFANFHLHYFLCESSENSQSEWRQNSIPRKTPLPMCLFGSPLMSPLLFATDWCRYA
jgi:hypothetical protein